MKTLKKIGEALLVALLILGALALMAGLLALPGLLTMWGWNLVAVPLFHAPALSFLQAWVIWLVLGILLRGRSVVRVVVEREKPKAPRLVR